jgi:hypothetical protein
MNLTVLDAPAEFIDGIKRTPSHKRSQLFANNSYNFSSGYDNGVGEPDIILIKPVLIKDNAVLIYFHFEVSSVTPHQSTINPITEHVLPYFCINTQMWFN